jgi:two-component system, LytTR family, response regulator
MLKTILIDDEPLAISRLKRLLSKFPDDFEVIATANNGHEGLEQIESLQPDIIFLDIEMPVMSGFDMLAQLQNMPLVVFVTAYDQYAIRAFEENSIDYLLKPVEIERLEKTVEKTRKFQAKPTENPFNAQLMSVLEKLKPKKEMHAISVRVGERYVFIPLNEIGHFEAEDKYVFLNTLDGKQHLISHTIMALEEKLPSYFVRVSRSSIVNTTLIKELQKDFNSKFVLVMKDIKRSRIKTGSSYSEQVRRLMEI